MTGELYNIELNKQEAEQFKTFRQYHDLFQKILDNNICDMKNGSVTLFFDKEGELRQIKKEYIAYKLIK